MNTFVIFTSQRYVLFPNGHPSKYKLRSVLNVFVLESELPADPARTAERTMGGVRRLRTGHSSHYPWWWRRRQSPKLCVGSPHSSPPYCEGWDCPLLGEPPCWQLASGWDQGSIFPLPAPVDNWSGDVCERGGVPPPQFAVPVNYSIQYTLPVHQLAREKFPVPCGLPNIVAQKHKHFKTSCELEHSIN
jgi:hypothetical protein